MRGWAPWLLLAVVAVAIGSALALGQDFDGVVVAFMVFVASTGVVGAVVASRLSGHPVGWLLLVASLCYAAGGALVSYVEAAVARGLPLGPWPVWLGNALFGSGVAIVSTFLLLVFPDGRLPSPRWKVVAWLSGASMAALVAGVTLSPEAFSDVPFANPVALDVSDPLLLALEGGGFYALTTAVLLSVASLVLRYRRSAGVERIQLRWVAFGVMVVALAILGTTLWELLNGTAELSDDVENLVITGALATVPVAIGIAILRYRLYDIDRLISRTVAYGAVTAVLVSLYASSVFVLRELLPLGGDLAVAASTLGVAALSDPLRRRLQQVVDRRFNRLRYDAARELEALGRRMRDERELTAIASRLTAAASSTMQPRSVSLWLGHRGGWS